MGSLRIVCSASGQPPRAARRQRERTRRKAPLPSFEEKLEQQRQRMVRPSPAPHFPLSFA